jgi:hypothetical protein
LAARGHLKRATVRPVCLDGYPVLHCFAPRGRGFAVKEINFFFYSAIHKLLTPFAQEIHRPAARAARADEICGSVTAALRFRVARFDQSNRNAGRIPIIPAGR